MKEDTGDADLDGPASEVDAGGVPPGIRFRSLGAVTFCSFLQLILQFLVVVWLAKRFGTSALMDAFNAAFAVPTALTGIFVAPLPLVLVPELVRLRTALTERLGWSLAATILTVSLISSVVVAFFGSLYSQSICGILFAGLDEFRLQKTSEALGWLVWLLPLNAAIALLQAMHHSQQRYVLAAVSNVVGVGLSFALIAVVPSLDLRVVSVALLAGSSLAVLILVVPISKYLMQNFRFRWTGIGLRRFTWLSVPLLLSAAYAKLDPLVDRSIASFLEPGAISELGYAQRVITALATLTASGLSVVIFPQLASLSSDVRGPRLAHLLSSAWRFLIILLTPCVAAICFYAKSIVADLFQREAFDGEATRAVARLLVILLGVLIAGSVGEIAAKSLYAMSKTRLPAIISVAGFTLGIALKWFFSKHFGVEGVALGTTVYFVCCLAALLVALTYYTGPAIYEGVGFALLQASVASAVALAAGAIPVMLLDRGGAFLGGGVGLVSYLVVLWIWGNEFLPMTRARSQG